MGSSSSFIVRYPILLSIGENERICFDLGFLQFRQLVQAHYGSSVIYLTHFRLRLYLTYFYLADFFVLLKQEFHPVKYGYSNSRNRLAATGTRVSYGIIQFYLPSDRGDVPALTPAEAGT